MSITEHTAFTDDEDVRKGAIVRIPAGDRKRPYCLKITGREPVSQATGAIVVHGIVLGVNGTTTRTRNLHRTAVLLPGRYEFTHRIPHFTAKLATLARQRGDGTVDTIHRWGVVNDETGEPLPGEGTGPVVIEHLVGSEVYRWTLVGNWEGKPAPWLAREYSEQTEYERRNRIDPLDQCVNRAYSERGILRIGSLVYDLTEWNHHPSLELREIENGKKAWRSTHLCKHCGQALTSTNTAQRPWYRAADGTTECSAEVYVP